jgi:hypothetical protein
MTRINNSLSIAMAALVSTSINSCIDQKVPQNNPAIGSSDQAAVQGNVFNKDVGKPIDQATAWRWMRNFRINNARGINSEYVIDGAALSEIMTNSSCVGISLHYATDDQGSLHLLPIGVDDTGRSIPTSSVSTQNGGIDWQTARRWIDRYSGSVRAHFFGTNAYSLLLVKEHAKQVRASLAQNDAAAPQLLLSNAGDSMPTVYVDASYVCPPICSL